MTPLQTLPKGVYRAGKAFGRHRSAPDASHFPFGLGREGVHEVCEAAYGDMAALTGFVLTAAQSGAGPVLWICQHTLGRDYGQLMQAGRAQLYARTGTPLLSAMAYKHIETLWMIEEAMRSGAVGLVIAELDESDFTASRRLALAASRQGVPAILLMPYTRKGATAATARWRISPRPSAPNRFDRHAPGAPRWRAVLERTRQSPHLAGSTFNLEFDDETLSLNVAPELVADTARPRHTG